jgi:tetratricopeptide (TPR) repeat protein
MVEFLNGRASERKLRLFACACCRRVWHLLADPRSRLVRDFKPDTRPAAELVTLAGVLTGRRLQEGEEVPQEAGELATAWKALEAKYPRDFAPPPAQVVAWSRQGAGECERRGLWAGAVLHLARLLAAAPTGELFARRARANTELRRLDRAAADYGKAVAQDATRWEWWAGRAEALAGLGKWDQASADYSKALERAERRPELWAGRARVEAERGKFDRAAADLEQLVRLRPRDPEVWHRQALALLAAGDTAGYRRLCGRLLKRFGRSGDAGVARAVARTCTLAPDAVADLAPLLQQAERAVAAKPSADDLRRLALLLYRSGQHKPALERLQEALRLPGQEAGPRDWLLQALAEARLGRAEEAKGLLNKAAALAKGKKEALPWPERVERQLWRREAEEAVKGAKP